MENLDNQVGIKINDLHTWHDFHMYLNAVYIGEAVQDLVTVEVPGRGSVNLSDFWKYPVYKTRTLKFEFDVEDGGFPGYYQISSALKSSLQGEEKKIILDEDNEYFWTGSVSVDVQKKNSIISAVTLTCSVDPYKYKIQKTRVASQISGNKAVICNNEYKQVVPTIIADTTFVLKFGEITAAVPAGTTIVPDLLLKPGKNRIECQGSGSITFEYQEASL